MRLIPVLALVAGAAPAFAAGPCARGPQTMKVAGIDLDAMRCALATYQELRTGDQAVIADLLVKNRMLQSDLADAQAALKGAEDELARLKAGGGKAAAPAEAGGRPAEPAKP